MCFEVVLHFVKVAGDILIDISSKVFNIASYLVDSMVNELARTEIAID